MQTGNAGTKKTTHWSFIILVGQYGAWTENKQKKQNKGNSLTFNMMESASGVKGMFILVTPGALDRLVRVSDSQCHQEVSVTVTVPHQNSHWSHE